MAVRVLAFGSVSQRFMGKKGLESSRWKNPTKKAYTHELARLGLGGQGKG